MIEPTYQKEGVTFYLGDCLEILPQLPEGCVDACVTDPPYGIGFAKYESHEDNPLEYAESMKWFVEQANRVVSGGPVFCWQGMLNADRWHQWFPPGFRVFAACKGFVQYRPTPVQFSWDPVIFWGTPKTQPSVYAKDYHEQRKAPFGAGRPKIPHPCPRPLEQVEYVVKLATNEGESILDPFMGSGTTGVACVQTGRRFIGIEKEPKYFEIAVKRIEKALKEEREKLPLGV